MMTTCPADYAIVATGSSKILVREEWKDSLLSDLLCDFKSVRQERRRIFSSGRVKHFSYLPQGACERVFVRRLVRGGMIRWCGNLHFGANRPLQELRAVEAAQLAGIDVPAILAVKATRVWGPFYRLVIVMREIPDASTLLDMVPSLTPGERHKTIRRLGGMIRRMHEVGIYHPDLTVHNIVLDADGEVHILDFDKAEIVARKNSRLELRDMARLNRSIEKTLRPHGCVSRVDKIRLLRECRAPGECLREYCNRCLTGLWRHRLWWAITGQA